MRNIYIYIYIYIYTQSKRIFIASNIQWLHIEMKHEVDGNINLYSYSIDCGFKKFATIDEK